MLNEVGSAEAHLSYLRMKSTGTPWTSHQLTAERQVTIRSLGQLRVFSWPHMHSFGLGEEAGHPERTHADTRRDFESTTMVNMFYVRMSIFALEENNCKCLIIVITIFYNVWEEKYFHVAGSSNKKQHAACWVPEWDESGSYPDYCDVTHSKRYEEVSRWLCALTDALYTFLV